MESRNRMMAAAVTALLLIATGTMAAGAAPREHIVNGSFTEGHSPWWNTNNFPFTTAGGAYCSDVPAGLLQYQAIVGQHGLAIEDGVSYALTFSAWSSVPTTIRAQVQPRTNPNLITYLNPSVSLGSERATFTFEFVAELAADVVDSSVQFRLGGNSASRICIDDVSLTAPEANPTPVGPDELIANSTFDDTTKPWWTSGGMPMSIEAGTLCVEAGASVNPWSLLLGQNSLYLPGNTRFRLSFDVRANAPVSNAVQIGPFYNPSNETYLSKSFAAGTTTTHYSYDFETPFDEPYVLSQLQFRLGGAAASYTVCYDNVSLTGTAYRHVADPGPAVKLNQVGYLPHGPKNATVVSDEAGPLRWHLYQGDVEVAAGETISAGLDPTAGVQVHTIDFSAVTAAGTDFTLRVGTAVSDSFEISADAFQSLRTDALRFFYTNRSGIAIDGNIAGDDYGREAGHLGVAPNQGDSLVGCQEPKPWMDGWTCDYTLDVTGGWYDAGDHGKYVVNGGIAAAQLLGAWERAVSEGTQAALGDSTLAIPERDNGVPDILDEARWELDFMLKMQVPEGEPLAGMVHHKVQDETWTGLPLLPSADPKPRQLHRPSTAATLNVAAAAAQGARLFLPYDAVYAGELLTAAQRAYEAAQANPTLLAPRADGVDGGGAYADDEVGDEFYWAATELYLTTRDQAYLDDVVANPLHTADVFAAGGFYWGSVAALARLQLARFGGELEDFERIRDSVLAAADELVEDQTGEPFGQPYSPADGRYVWGSNSSILNNQVVLGTAFDLTSAPVYARAVLEGYDYLMGRNVLGQSYITGYGDRYARNQHSRWYARSLDPDLPNPPIGSIAGGPNSDLQDPISQTWLRGCAPQACYVDNIEAWAVNEITVNWNSALVWVASFVADLGDGTRASESAPVFTTHPHDVTVVEGDAAVFSVESEARPRAALTWQRRSDGDWVDLGRAGAVLTLDAVGRSLDGMQIRALASNGVGDPVASETATLTVEGRDTAVSAPARGVLSHDNGWDTGLRDGSFTVTMNLWWGENATILRLYENGVLIAKLPLEYRGVSSQTVAFPVTGRVNGQYVYTGELSNSVGTTQTGSVTVEVTQATPGPVSLSHDNTDRDGRYTISADMWWGTNATSYRLLENGAVVAEGSLEARTPDAQHISVPISGRAAGSHVYIVELSNSAGTTQSKPMKVTVSR